MGALVTGALLDIGVFDRLLQFGLICPETDLAGAQIF